MNGIYLDNAATSFPKPEEVYRAVEDYMRRCGGTPARGRHPRALHAGRVVSECRQGLLRLLGAPTPEYALAFTSGATEALNLALKGLLPPEAHVVVTDLEHNSVFRPLQALRRERGVRWTRVAPLGDGTVAPGDIARAMGPETRLVVTTHASNVLGTVLDVPAIAEVAHRRGVPVLVDAAQTAGVVPLSIGSWEIDMLAFTGHKSLLGPPGTGGLIFRSDLPIRPIKEGGTGTSSERDSQPEELPDRLEAGSPNMYGIAGLAAAVGFLERLGVESIGRRKARQLAELRARLAAIPGIRLYGSADPQRSAGILAFNVEGVSSERVAEELWKSAGIMVRAGLHCAPHLHAHFGTLGQGMVRVGIGFSTSDEELRILADTVASGARAWSSEGPSRAGERRPG